MAKMLSKPEFEKALVKRVTPPSTDGTITRADYDAEAEGICKLYAEQTGFDPEKPLEWPEWLLNWASGFEVLGRRLWGSRVEAVTGEVKANAD